MAEELYREGNFHIDKETFKDDEGNDMEFVVVVKDKPRMEEVKGRIVRVTWQDRIFLSEEQVPIFKKLVEKI